MSSTKIPKEIRTDKRMLMNWAYDERLLVLRDESMPLKKIIKLINEQIRNKKKRIKQGLPQPFELVNYPEEHTQEILPMESGDFFLRIDVEDLLLANDILEADPIEENKIIEE